jgi:3-isopropylmalate/(R)-2-methylmalate dehydratase small subunit
MNKGFNTLHSRCVPFFKDDVDTDQIIPARFLKGTTKAGFAKNLFYDWRYDEAGHIRPDSIFDIDAYEGAHILVAGNNFGCGSSREHAPWALKDFGFQVLIAHSYADIFYNNALKNFLLPITLPMAEIKNLVEQIEMNPALQLRVDLEKQTVMIPEQGTFHFEISAFRKTCLLEGLDDIAYVLSHHSKIDEYEAKRESF